MSYFTFDVIAREQLTGVPSGPVTAVEAEEEVIGVFPVVPRRLQLQITAPLQFLVRTPVQSGINLKVLIRSLIQQQIITEAAIRREIKELFQTRNVVLNQETKQLLQVLKEMLLVEESA